MDDVEQGVAMLAKHCYGRVVEAQVLVTLGEHVTADPETGGEAWMGSRQGFAKRKHRDSIAPAHDACIVNSCRQHGLLLADLRRASCAVVRLPATSTLAQASPLPASATPERVPPPRPNSGQRASTATANMSGPVATARPIQALRLRRESQRPGVARTMARPSTMEDESAKQDTRRYGTRQKKSRDTKATANERSAVYTQQEILARHKGKPPSLRIFLHPKHFRINDSSDMLEYTSPMRELLEHVRSKTVPHNMVDDFYAAEIPFYDNCLIVELNDYRSNGAKPRDDTNSLGDSGTSAFSIHNYNSFITPSPHAPYPSSNKSDAKSKQAEAQAKEAENKEDKENMPAPAQNGVVQKQVVKPKTWTVVCFPTPQSHQADMQLLASTPLPDLAALKRMQAAGRGAGMPPTPMTAVPPTPTFPTGPSPKRQKMVLDDTNIYEFESEFYNATCPKLHLEPTKSFQESLALMDAMTHQNNKNEPPARKTRKRTTAELQADEAEAAATQRFMLAGDEQQAHMATTATGGDEGTVRAAANTQNFSRLKTLANIKANHEEADRRKKEEDARVAQAKRQAQIEAEAQKRRDMESNRQQAELHERQALLLRQQAAQQQQLQQNEALRAATQAQQMANATAAQMNLTPQSATQPQFSPAVRDGTPMTAAAASPRTNGQANHPMGGTPMVATASNHAIVSPARPPSAISHQQMARSASQQQNLSRTGTPQIVQGTPVMNAAMPNRNMTPTPIRMGQGSPSMSMQGATPIMMHTPQPGQNMTPEHLQQLQNQQAMQQRMLQQQHMQQQPNASPGMSQLQQLAISKAQQYVRQHGLPPGQNPQHYQTTLARRFFQSLQQQQQNQQQAAQQQQAMQNMSPQGNPQVLNPTNMNLTQLRQHHQQRKIQLIQQYGQQGIPQQEMMRLRQLEQAIVSRTQAEQQSQMQLMNPGMQAQMQSQMQAQMNGLPNGVPNNLTNPIQMQAYQQMLQQQRAQQARAQQAMAMRQQAMQQGGQLPQGMMNNVNMQGMNMQNMQGMNMQNMQGMQGMNMQGMQGMQGMNMGQLNQQQVQQMMMMRQAQQQAQQRMGQPGQQGGGGGGDMGGWTG
jgi:transcription factor SPT20